MESLVEGRGAMPRYFFNIPTGDGGPPERAAELSDDAAALAYACEMVREWTQMGTHVSYPGLVVRVSDETRPMVFSVPFLAACA
jgi:hypothetical protein